MGMQFMMSRSMAIHDLFRISRRRIGILLIAATLVGALTQSASAQLAAQTNLRFTLDSKFDGTSAPFMVGIDRGYYKAENLNVTIEGASELLEPITRVATGLHDMGVADMNSYIRYRDQNPTAPVVAVFVVYSKPGYAIVGRKSRGVTTPKDLEGKKLGAPAADPVFAYWRLFAKVNEIDPSKVAVENVGFPVREPLLQNGQVDAITGFSYSVLPALKFMGLQSDDVVPLLMADNGLKLYGNVIIVNTKFAAEKPAAVKGFLQAYIRGLRDSVRNPTLAVESALRRNDAALKEVELERLRMVLKENILTPEVKSLGLGAVDPARLDLAIEQLGQIAELKSKPKAADIFNDAYLPPMAIRRVH
jgi:NitT/TauT family transport system substrate-binding protein